MEHIWRRERHKGGIYGERASILQGSGQLFFWRTRSGSEVDFVIYGPETLVAIEVKASATVHGRDVRSLRTFLQDYPQASLCLLHAGRERISVRGVPCLPVDGFLRGLVPDGPLLPG
jgi:predicted AAA+ superfamily ATPase